MPLTSAVPALEKPPSVRVDAAYALVMLGNTIVYTIVDGWLLYFYFAPEGEGTPRIPATLAGGAVYGLAIFLPLLFNALFAPLIGYWSDNLRARWGRRLPLMFAAALPWLVVFVLLWTPPQAGASMWNLVYLAGAYLLYTTTYTLLLIPYGALLPELAQTDRHRVRMTTWNAVAQLLAVVLAGLAGFLIEPLGYLSMALVYAGATLGLLYLPFLVLRERPDRQVKPEARLTFRQSLALTLNNYPFRVLTMAGALFWIGSTYVMTVIPYIVTEICGLTKADVPYFYLPAVAVALVCYPLVNRLTGRIGKWRVFSGSMLASAVVLPGLMAISDRWPIPLAAQGVVWVMLQAAALTGVTMLPQAFAAEITDYDALQTGQRREGAYYSAWVSLGQIINGMALATLPLLLLLGRSQTDPQGPLGVRLTGLIGGGLFLLAFVIFQRYPLKKGLGQPA